MSATIRELRHSDKKQLETVRHLCSELMTLPFRLTPGPMLPATLRDAHVEVQLVLRAGNKAGAISKKWSGC